MSAFIQINARRITRLTVSIFWAVFLAQTHLTVQFKWHLGEGSLLVTHQYSILNIFKYQIIAS